MFPRYICLQNKNIKYVWLNRPGVDYTTVNREQPPLFVEIWESSEQVEHVIPCMRSVLRVIN